MIQFHYPLLMLRVSQVYHQLVEHELTDIPSTSAGTTTVSTIPSIQQKKMKPFKLADAIKPIEYDEMQRMSKDSFNRILQAEGLKEFFFLELIVSLIVFRCM